MKSNHWKHYIIFIIIGIAGLVLLFFRIRYFSAPTREADVNGVKTQDSTKAFIEEVSSSTDALYKNITQGVAKFNEAMLREADYERIFNKDAIRLEEDMLKKLNEKNVEKLDPSITGLAGIFPKVWSVSFSTIEKGLDENMAAKAYLRGTSTCAIMNLEFYSAERSKVLQDIIDRFNGDAVSGMCKKKIIFKTEKYVILNVCSNDVSGCDQEKFMQKTLDEYFSPNPTL